MSPLHIQYAIVLRQCVIHFKTHIQEKGEWGTRGRQSAKVLKAPCTDSLVNSC